MTVLNCRCFLFVVGLFWVHATPPAVRGLETKPLTQKDEKLLSGVAFLGVSSVLNASDDPIEFTRRMLKHPSKEVRCPAMEYLARDTRDLTILSQFYLEVLAQLSEEDDDSKAIAAKLVGRLGAKAKDAVPKLERLLTAKDANVRCHALASLLRIQGKVTAVTRQHVENCPKTETDSFCLEVIRAFAESGVSESDLLWSLFQNSKSDAVRRKALGAVGTCSRKLIGSRDRLVAILEDPKIADGIRTAAAFALGEENCGEPEVATLIRAMLGDRSGSIQSEACRALAKHPRFAKAIRPAIVAYRLLEDDINHRAFANIALEELDAASAKEE